jgi:hypothetical protein
MSRFLPDALQVKPVADLARRPTQGGRGVLLLPPVLAFLAGNVFYGLAAAALAPGASYLQPVLHARWDSWNYANIARVGYLLQPCNPATSPFSASDWCGTAGWFPLYPLGMQGLHHLGLSWPAAGWLLSELFTFGSLLLIWILLGARLTAANLWCLALAVVFPGSIYYHAVFPISLVTFATLGCVVLLGRGRWVAGGLVGAVAAASYPLGLMLVPAVALGLVLGRKSLPARVWVPRVVATSALVGVGGLFVVGLQHQAVGHWDAYLKVQASYGNGTHNPAQQLHRVLLEPVVSRDGIDPRVPYDARDTFNIEQARARVVGHFGFTRGPQAQFTLTVLLVALGLALTYGRRPAGLVDTLIALCICTFWVAPLLVAGSVTLHRSNALLLPLVVLLRDLSRLAQAALVLVATTIAWVMAMLFYVSVLI